MPARPTAGGERSVTEAALARQSRVIATNSETTEGLTPKIETAAYQRSKPRWQKCRDLMIGSEAIRDGGELYLVAHPNEGVGRYDTRRVLAALFNGFARTVQASVGLLVSEEPTLADDMPLEIVKMAESVDGAGTHLTVFTAQLALAGMVDGFAGIITEYPRANDPRIDFSKASRAAQEAAKTGQPLDQADETALGLRPYFILVKADQVLLPLYEVVNGQKTLTMLILKETVTRRKGTYGIQSVVRYRVYMRKGNEVTYELWTEGDDGQERRTEGPTLLRNVDAIPWSPLPVGRKLGDAEYMPTLMDLAELNLEHHNVKTNILSLESLACVPTPVRIGAKPNAKGEYPDMILGPGNTIEAPATQGVSTPVYWLAPPVDVLATAMKSLENTKSEMGAMGAAFLAPQPVQETATAKRMDASAEVATIQTVSRALKDCLESAFGFAAQYIKKVGGSVTLNEDFVGEGIDSTYLSVLVTAYQNDVLTLQELRHVIQTGQLPEDFSSDDQAVIDELLGQAVARQEAALQTMRDTAPPSSNNKPRNLKLNRGADGKVSGISEVA